MSFISLPPQSNEKIILETIHSKISPAVISPSSPHDIPATVLVTRVIDGDTIEIAGGERVRYIGIDTPETVSPRKPIQCFGKEASQRNTELVLGKNVRLVSDVRDRDQYGRLLRYVYVDDLFINRELIAEGYARIETIPPDVAHAKEFLAAERDARATRRGLWAACT